VHSAAASDMYPPVRALPTHITSGLTPAVPGGEQRAGAAEPGGDLVERQQHVVLGAGSRSTRR
jgi:hypothetical protein